MHKRGGRWTGTIFDGEGTKVFLAGTRFEFADTDTRVRDPGSDSFAVGSALVRRSARSVVHQLSHQSPDDVQRRRLCAA